MSACFWAKKPIQVNLQFRALVWTAFSFLTQGANFKPKDSCTECFDANLKQYYSCAKYFAQVLS